MADRSKSDRQTSDCPKSEWEARGQDRRRRPTPMLCRFTFVGRRSSFRRQGEDAGAYVDRPESGVLLLLGSAVLLCLFDAFATLHHVSRGGGELNPLMRAALGVGPVFFVSFKCGLTGLALLFLALHQNFRRVRAILAIILVFYLLLSGYHLYLAALR